MSVAAVQATYEAFGCGDVPGILAHLSDGVVWRVNAPPVVPDAGECRGRAAVGEWFGRLARSEDITRFAPEIFVTSGAHVVAVGIAKGIARPTGRDWSARWVHVWTFHNGRVTSFEDILDSASIAAASATCGTS